MPRKLWSGLLMAFGAYLALAGVVSFYVAMFGAGPIRLWASGGGGYYQFTPQENSHPLVIGAAFIVAAWLLGAISIRVWRAKR